jgi:hypothetical protein
LMGERQEQSNSYEGSVYKEGAKLFISLILE